MPRPTYFFAIETTRRRLASVSWRLASSPSVTRRASAVPFLLELEFAGFDAHRKRLLLLHREQRNAPDLLEIHANRIVEREPIGDRLLLLFFDRLAFGLLFLLLVDDLDAGGGDLFEKPSISSGLTSSSASNARLISSYVSELRCFPRAMSFFFSSSSVNTGCASATAAADFLRATRDITPFLGFL